MSSTAPDVIVIGAGPAGIASAYQLERAGLDYLVLDRAEIVGSTWASLYPSLKLNTSRFYSHMVDEPFPWRYGLFPTGQQYHAYLTAYAEKHRFNIRFGVTVQSVVPDGDQWRVVTDQGDWRAPAVIAATGVWNNPVMPSIPGLERFEGALLHAHDFRNPEQVRNQRLLVVGNGPSGIDIATAATATAQRPVMIGIRSGVDLRPRYPYGLPKHAWMMIGEALPEGLCAPLQRVTGALRLHQERYGLQRPPEDKPGTAIAYRGPELLHAVRDGTVTPVPAPVEFLREGARFADGRVREFDAVVMGTGYQPVLHQYLALDFVYAPEAEQPPIGPCEWRWGPNGIRGWPARDIREHPNGRQVLGHPGLYLVGTFYKGKGAMYNFNVEAAVAAEQIRAYLAAQRVRVAVP